MLRMEIALFLVLAFVAFIYFSAERRHTPLHRTFSLLLVVVLAHLALDGPRCTPSTIWTRCPAGSTTGCTGFSSAPWCWWCIFSICAA